MTRQQKYPETNTFHYYNANPHNRLTTDCVVRALCTALEQGYERTVTELAEFQCQTGYDTSDSKLYDKYLQYKGWIKHKQPRKEDNTKYTGKEFCERARAGERYVANIGGGHVVAIVNGKVYDTWDGTKGSIGNYWTKG